MRADDSEHFLYLNHPQVEVKDYQFEQTNKKKSGDPN